MAIKLGTASPGIMLVTADGSLAPIALLDTNPIDPVSRLWSISYWPDNLVSAPAVTNATSNPATFTPPAAAEWYVVRLVRTLLVGTETLELPICIPDPTGTYALPCPGIPADIDPTKTIVNLNDIAKILGWAGGERASLPGLAGAVRKSLTDAAAAVTGNATNTQAVNTSKVKNNALFQGAIGDGVADDQPAIQAALTAMGAAGGGEFYLPAGTYRLGSKISVPTGVVLRGDGIDKTIIKATAGAAHPWVNVPGEGMIEFRGVFFAGLQDLTVDGNGVLRTPGTGGDPSTDTLDILIPFAGAQHCRLTRVRVTGGGYATSTGGTPSGPNVLLVAKDAAADIGSQFGTVANQDCSNNSIVDCVFDDASGACRVAKYLGIITDFGCRTAGGSPHNYAFNLSRRQTAIGGAVSAGATNILVSDAHGFAIGDSIRIERLADSTLFDHGNVTAIPDATHVTIDTATSRTYALNDKFGISYDALSPFGTGGAPSSALRGRSVDVAGSGRNGVATTVSGSMSSGVTSVLVTTSADIALGDTIQITRTADHTLFDRGVVTAIPDGTHVTINTSTTRTYAASDIVTVTAFSAAGGFNGGEFFANHAQDNLIEGCTFSGVANLYAIGLQGGGTCRNTVRRNRFTSIRALGSVLVDKGAYDNDVSDNKDIDHQRDPVFLTSSPIAAFVGRSLPSYYDTDNVFKRNRVVSFVGTLEYDAPFAVGEGAVRQIWRGNTVNGATVPSNLGIGYMIGQGNIDCEIDGGSINGTNYGIFSNLGGAPLVPASGGKITRVEINVTHQAIQLSATASAVAPWGGVVQVERNVVTGSVDVGGQIAVDTSFAFASVQDNWVSRSGTPGGGHIGVAVSAANGVVAKNIFQNQPTLVSYGGGFAGVKFGNRDATGTVQDFDAIAFAIASATPVNAALAIMARDASGNVACQTLTVADIDNVAATTVRVGKNTLTTEIGTSGGNFKLCGGTARTLPTRAGQLNDSSGGVSGGNTVAAIGGAVDPTAALKADTANAIATLAAKINALEARLSNAALGHVTQ